MIYDIHINIIDVVMKPKYITPRIAIVQLNSHVGVEKLLQLVETRHKQYHHYFNLTMFKVREDK